MRILIALLLATISFSALAIENQFLMRIGGIIGHSFADPGLDDDEYEYQKNKVITGGLTTSFGYVFTKYEFGIASQIHTGSIKDFHLEESGDSLHGDGTVAMENFAFYVKRYTEYYPVKFWRLFFTAAPSITFNTIKLRNFVSTSDAFTHNHKVTMDAAGITMSVGIEENAKLKSSRPNFVRLIYSAHAATAFSIIDATDYTKVESLYESKRTMSLIIHTVLLEVGFVLF
jgi:hypothetical protein